MKSTPKTSFHTLAVEDRSEKLDFVFEEYEPVGDQERDLRFDQPMLQRVAHQLDACMQLQFGHQPRFVGFNGFLTQEELLGGLAIGIAHCHEN